MKDIFKKTLTAVMLLSAIIGFSQIVSARETSINPAGAIYEFGGSDHYNFSAADVSGVTVEENALGTFYINGDAREEKSENGMPTYVVSSGNLSFSYSFDGAILGAEETEWHLLDDKTTKADAYSFSHEINSGALMIQSSLDGEHWITDVEKTIVFDGIVTLRDTLYTTKDIQLDNGCYYRAIIVYKLGMKTGEKKNVLGLGSTDEIESKKIAEVYTFYAESSMAAENAVSSDDQPRKELARKPVNTGKDTGFSEENAIDKDDPHFGWTLGSFVINGYTRETLYNNEPVFLKNVGDKVTLWFKLEQDINKLNGNKDLIINKDFNGYDQEFGITQTNFGHGCLIISYTDFEGNTHDPVIYTDFLAADATTGADTRVQLFEEGDYTVSLDYEIEDTTRMIGLVPAPASYTNYKIKFSFSIRNGNCMVYPFDTELGNELADNAITENGFRLDMARSRYLNIDVTRSVLNVGPDGTVTEDVRFNRPAKDNDSYTDEGIYTFEVKNLYTGASTIKKIYVGSDIYLQAMSKNSLTLNDLNENLLNGVIIEEDGTLTQPVEEESEVESVAESQASSIAESVLEDAESSASLAERLTGTDSNSEKDRSSSADMEKKKKTSQPAIPFVLAGMLCGLGITAWMRKKK